MVILLFVLSLGPHLLWIAGTVVVIAWTLGLGRYRRRRYEERYKDRYERNGWFRR